MYTTSYLYKYRIPILLTYILNPMIVPPVALVLVSFHTGASEQDIITVLSRSMGLYFFTPGAMLYFLRRAGFIRSFEVRTRRNRLIPLLGGMVITVAAIPIVSADVGPATEFVFAVAASFAMVTFAAAIVTLRIKLSLHVTAYTGLFVLLVWLAIFIPPGRENVFIISPVLACASLLLVLIVVWARICSGAHTIREVGTGIIFGLTSTAAALYLVRSVLPMTS